VKLSPALKNFIAGSTRSYGKVKLVLKHNRFWVETADSKVLGRCGCELLQ
jgi:DNA excision repair protein ERCC-3